MITIDCRKCKTCAWLKKEDPGVMKKCQLKGFEVYEESMACDEWSEIGLL